MTNKILLILLTTTVLLQPGAFGQTPLKWQIKWTDHAANPVDLKSPGTRAYMPYVLYNADWPAESRFRVWYDTESNAGLAYSFSADGLNWATGAMLTGIHTAADSNNGLEFAGRPVILYQKSWAKPYRVYYYGKTDSAAHKIWVAESANGINFENHQLALDPAAEGSRLGTFPDGHAVVYLPGRNPTPDDPEAARPFIMYFRDKGNQGIAYALSWDGYTFTELPDNLDTPDVVEGLIEISGLPEGATALPAQPTQVLQLAQNDLRMWAFDQNTSIKYLVSANGLKWVLIEDPVADVGGIGPEGAWNDQRNYYASAAYLGNGRFFLLRGGRNNSSGLYRTGAAFGESAFYKAGDLGRWAFYSPMNDFQGEGWAPFTTSGNEPDGNLTAVIQNADGTVSVRDRKESGNFYIRHDTAWVVPFTVELRARLDDATGTGADSDHPKFTAAAFQTDPDQPGGEAWQPAFALTRFGSWTLATDPSADVDLSRFQTFTFVSRFDESARAQLAENPANGGANVNLAVFDVYLNRDFSAPKVTFHNTGFLGWDTIDYDGGLDIGFPGPSAGQVTVDWVRWGNGVILDPNGPEGAARPTLNITREVDGVRLSWTGAGTLQSANDVTGPWGEETGVTSGAKLPLSASRKFYRVQL